MSRKPEQCQDMQELRHEIDQIDQNIMALLKTRADFIDRAIEIKRDIGLHPRVPKRVEEVVSRQMKRAEALGHDPEFIGPWWRQLVEWSIAREALVLEINDDSDNN